MRVCVCVLGSMYSYVFINAGGSYVFICIHQFRRFYEEAITKGYVETSVTKCLIIGAAGVGKTHLKHLLLKMDPPEQRTSTGLADNPIRAVSSSMAGVGGQEDDWFPVEDGRALMKIVCSKIEVGNVSMATSLEEVVSSLPKITINMSSDGAGAGHSDSVPTGVNITMDTTQQSKTSAIEELIDYINHPTGKTYLRTDQVNMYNFL